MSFEDYEAGKYNKDDEWLYSSFWYKDFDGMAYKTMLRQLISKWGIMSIEMETAFNNDMAVIDENGTAHYVDSQPDIVEIMAGEVSNPFDKEGESEPNNETVIDEVSNGEQMKIEGAENKEG